MSSSNEVKSPNISFSALAQLLGPVTPAKQASLIRGFKFPSDGPKRSYQNATKYIINQLLGAPVAPRRLRPHEQEVVDIFDTEGISLPVGLNASRPNPHGPSWNYRGVNISMFPDAELEGPRGSGALKLYLGKDKLARSVGPSMAALLHHFRQNVQSDASVHPGYCLVYEVRAGALYSAGKSPARLLNNVDLACQAIVALWSRL